MNPKLISDYAGILTSMAAVLAGVLGITKYFKYRNRQDELRLVAENFNKVVASLRSDSTIERMAGAISLRRFHDQNTESGILGAPYSKEALNIATAILRGQVTSDFQKLLADGLAFAPSLQRADLQRTNLQFAYLGKKGDNPDDKKRLDLRGADFFGADLSGASLKGADAQKAVFYQARMHNTVLSEADLQQADFREADLQGAKFDGASIYGAKFAGARNIPEALDRKLTTEDRVYRDTAVFHPGPASCPVGVQDFVFVSKPGYLSSTQQQRLTSLLQKLEPECLHPQKLERRDYPNFGAIREVQRRMSGCVGAIIYGPPQLRVARGSWRLGTPEERQLRDADFASSWSQIEAGMAVMLGIPMLVLRERDVTGGIFDIPPGEPGIYQAHLDDDWNEPAFLNTFSQWCSSVRENGRRSRATQVKASAVPGSA